MTRVAGYLTLLMALPAPVGAQSMGSVLTSSDIYSDHLIQSPVAVEGRTWLALMPPTAGSRLEPVRPSWTVSMLFGDSVFTLALDPPIDPAAMPLLLLGDVPGIAAGEATTVTEFEESLSPDARALSLTLGEATYQLELTGSDAMLCDAVLTLRANGISQQLYTPGSEPFSCDEPHFSVQWAGDLDGDGRLDLVTTFSPKYSWYPRRLWLSTAAAPGELVGLVAVLEAAAA